MNHRRPRATPALRRPEGADRARTRMRALADGKFDQWYRIKNNSGVAEVWLYDEIGYYGVAASDFVRELRDLGDVPLNVHINSPGGDVFDGIAIYNAIRSHPKAVTVHIDGLAASAASFIAMAGDTIKIARNAQVMIHDALSICFGNAEDMRATADLLNKCSNNIADIYAQRAGGTAASWRTKMRAETWYTGAEAVKAGLVDEVYEAEDRNEFTGREFAAAIRQGIALAAIDARNAQFRKNFDPDVLRAALREMPNK